MAVSLGSRYQMAARWLQDRRKKEPVRLAVIDENIVHKLEQVNFEDSINTFRYSVQSPADHMLSFMIVVQVVFLQSFNVLNLQSHSLTNMPPPPSRRLYHLHVYPCYGR